METELESLVASLVTVLTRSCEPTPMTWLRTQVGRADAAGIAATFSLASRKFGSATLTLSPEDRGSAAQLLTSPDWSCRDLARAALLLAFARRAAPAELESVVKDLFYKGDNDERRVVLRTLHLLPQPERYMLLATDAARSHVQPVFEAIACNNPYPAQHLPDPAFNQIVMKAFFTGVAVERVLGLTTRQNAELERMALDYAAERRAAGRSIPADLARAAPTYQP